jgi:hypothetical protein
VVVTVEESVLKTEMSVLESQEEDAPKRILFFKPMSWLSLTDIFLHVYGSSDPDDYGEAARDLWLQEISVRPPR